MRYGIGQKLTLKEQVEVETGITGTKKILKAGTKCFVTASKKTPMVIYTNGMIQMLPQDTEIEGFSASGITEWIYNYLNSRLPLSDMMDDYDVGKEEVTNAISEALEELSFYNAEGNMD